MNEQTWSMARFHQHGGPDVLKAERVSPGKPQNGEVVIRQEAIGLNFIDTYFRSGLYPTTLPSGLGNEAAGVIERLGPDVKGFSVGDRVGYFTGPLGAYASHRLIGVERLVHLPEGVSAQQAAAAMLKGCTAEYLIERCGRVQPGQVVLVHAAAGGVGSILVQWLRTIGAQVIAHSGDARKASLAKALGAHHSLFCPMHELAAEVRSLTDGAGAQCVLDGVGAASWQTSLDAVRQRGLIVSFGNASGPVPAFTAIDLMRAGSVFVTRPTLADYTAAHGEMQASATRLFDMMLRGMIEVQIGATFGLSRAADAHRAMEQRATTGSTLLLPD